MKMISEINKVNNDEINLSKQKMIKFNTYKK